MGKEIKTLWDKGRVHGLELIVDTLLLVFTYLSISFWLRTVLPSPHNKRRIVRDNAIDAYCFAQLVVLSLLLVGQCGPIVDSLIAGYIIFEIYLSLLNIVFIGKFREINAPPASVERSILLLLLNIVQVILTFGILYRDWLGLSRLDGIFKAILVLGTVGYPDAPGSLVLIVALQVFLDVLLFVLVLSSFVGQLGLFSNGNPRSGAEASNTGLKPPQRTRG